MKILLTLLLLTSSLYAEARCVCSCVNGRMQAICTSTIDSEPMCMGICPMAPPRLEPLPSVRLPPLGTSHCHPEQVWDEYEDP